MIFGTGPLATSGHIFNSYISMRCLNFPQSMITYLSLVKECKPMFSSPLGRALEDPVIRILLSPRPPYLPAAACTFRRER